MTRKTLAAILVALLSVAAVLAGCSGSDDKGASGSSAPVSAPPSVATQVSTQVSTQSAVSASAADASVVASGLPASDAAASGSEPTKTTTDAGIAAAAPYDCLSDTEKRENFRQLPVHSGDFQATVDAVEFGSGPVGIMLSHQSNGDLCQWLDEALVLAKSGYRVIVPSYQANHYVDYALAGIDRLRRDGATSLVLIGASMGGTISLATASKLKPAPKAVVSLSGPSSFAELDVTTSVGMITAPVLFAVGSLDGQFAADAKSLFGAATKSAGKQLLVVAGSSDHGVDLISDGSAVSATMLAFLAKYAPPR